MGTDNNFHTELYLHCVKTVKIWRYFCSVFSPNTGEYGPEITL